EAEIDRIWAQLIEGGKIMMPLNTYPWSSKYGWVADKYGVNWQLMLDHVSGDKVYPNLMFTGDNNGKAAEAIEFYTGIFPNSKTVHLSPYGEGGADAAQHLSYAQFLLNNQAFGAMDSTHMHAFAFNEGVSNVIVVDSQEEIDYFWDQLTTGGKPGKCGWLKDRYGVSWQVVPSCLGKFMTNPETAPKATYAFLQMS
ncbi:MAG: VOC family protein, partial [Aquirufa sp.]